MQKNNDGFTADIEELISRSLFKAAENLSRQRLHDNPDNIELLYLLGNAAACQGNFVEAVSCFTKACSRAPDKEVLWKNLGFVQQQTGDVSGAIESLQRALALEPVSSELWATIGTLYVAEYSFDKAATCYRRALQLGHVAPADLLNRIATLQVYLGESEKALDTFDLAIKHATDSKQQCQYTQNRLFSMHYPATITPEVIAQAHKRWGESFFNTDCLYEEKIDAMPGRRLRIGYVSPDFRMNAVCFFIQPVLKCHDRSVFDIYCYANVKKPDGVTASLQKELGVHWRDISSFDDEQAFSLIRQDKIDILIDLTGHGGDNRLPLFALCPAPIQMTWIGYPDTTGLKSVDYRITDALADPVGLTEHLHTEQLLRMPGCFLCYNPGLEFPPVRQSPFVANRYITFGSMSNFSKITPQLIQLWAEILKRVPNSRMVLRYRGQEHESVFMGLGRQLEQQGISSDRLTLLGHASSVIEQLEGYAAMDIALDTFPYNGTTTTCEALWMGVPVITLAGRSHVSRVGVSLLTVVGLSQCIADTPEAYIEKAVVFAENPQLLFDLRDKLRQVVVTSPLCDHQQFTKEVEKLYRMAWEKKCLSKAGVIHKE